jgi:hypothetical protein
MSPARMRAELGLRTVLGMGAAAMGVVRWQREVSVTGSRLGAGALLRAVSALCAVAVLCALVAAPGRHPGAAA